MADAFRYLAFLSYSHRDRAQADWLHRALESYRVPRRLVGRPGRDGPLPKRLFPVFRDREELPSSADLSANIGEALRASRTLIVLCSPSAAASRWVDEEVLAFKRLGRSDRILAVIVDGEPNASDTPELGAPECFPRALRHTLGEDGELTTARTEPIAADLRAGGDGRHAALLKTIAGVLGVSFDALRQRDREARRRRWLWRAAGGIAVVTLVVVLSIALIGGSATERDFEAGRRALLEGDGGSAAVWFANSYTAGPAADPNMSLLLGQAMATVDATRIAFRADCERVADLAVSPDGTLLALLCMDASGKIEIRRARDGFLMRTITTGSGLGNQVRFLADGRLLSTSGDAPGAMWDPATGRKLATLGGERDYVYRAAGVAGDAWLVASAAGTDARGDRIRVFRGSDGTKVAEYAGKWSENQGEAGTAQCFDEAGGSRVRDVGTGRVLREFGEAGLCRFSGDGTRLLFVPEAAGPNGPRIRQLDVRGSRELPTIELGQRKPQSVRYSTSDATSVLVVLESGAVELYAAASGALTTSIEASGTKVAEAEFVPGDRLLVTSDQTSGWVQIWGLPRGVPLRRFLHNNLTQSVPSPVGGGLATLSDNNLVSLFDLSDLERGLALRGTLRSARPVALDPSGRTALAWREGALRAYDVTSGHEVAELVRAGENAVVGAVSEDGTRVVAGGTTGWVAWRVGQGKPIALAEPSPYSFPLRIVASFAEDGRSVAVLGQAIYSKWSLSDGAVQARYDLGLALASAGALSRDGRRFAVAVTTIFPRQGSRIVVHDVRTGARVSELDATGMSVTGMSFDDGGRLVAAGTASGRPSAATMTAVWQVEPAKLLRRWDPVEGAPSGIALSADGARMLVGIGDHLDLYDVADGGLLLRLKPARNVAAWSSDRQIDRVLLWTDGGDVLPEWRLSAETRTARAVRALVDCRVPLRHGGTRLWQARRDDAACEKLTTAGATP